jgi:hydrophobic/amphiphilic exporter-1 (mainly G- bacteria), HAE1 family
MEMGKNPMQAAYDASKEVAFTILSMTLSLVAVFIPVLFMGGIVGRLLHEFAITITAAILISGFVSISLTPMLCSRFLHPPRDQRHGRLYWLFERVFDSWRGLYSRTLRVSLRYRSITASVSLLLIVATVYLFFLVPKGFLPSEDQGRFNVNTEGAQGISFDEMVRHQLQVADVLLKDPNIASAGVNVGQMGNNATGGSNQGRMFVELKPREQRQVSVDQVIAELRPKLAEIPGIRTFMVNQPPINLGGGGQNRALYQFTMQDTDTAELYKWAPVFEAKIRQTPGFEDVNSDLQLNNPQVTVEMNRDKLSTLGLSATQVENALYNAYGAVAHPLEQRPPDSIGVGRAGQNGSRPVPGEPLRSTAGGHHRLQSRARVRARRRSQRDSIDGRHDAAGHHQPRLPGHGAGVPGFAARARSGAGDGDRRHLHRARRAV